MNRAFRVWAYQAWKATFELTMRPYFPKDIITDTVPVAQPDRAQDS